MRVFGSMRSFWYIHNSIHMYNIMGSLFCACIIDINCAGSLNQTFTACSFGPHSFLATSALQPGLAPSSFVQYSSSGPSPSIRAQTLQWRMQCTSSKAPQHIASFCSSWAWAWSSMDFLPPCVGPTPEPSPPSLDTKALHKANHSQKHGRLLEEVPWGLNGSENSYQSLPLACRCAHSSFLHGI